MKKLIRTQSSTSPAIARDLLQTRNLGRICAFLVIALVAAALAVSTVGLAKPQKKSQKPKPEVTVEAENENEFENEGEAGSESERKREESKKREGKKAQESAKAPSVSNLELQEEGLFRERKPREDSLKKAREFDGDLRNLPQIPPVKFERPEREGPAPHPRAYEPAPGTVSRPIPQRDIVPTPAAPAPTPLITFEGMDFNTWGAGHPPDTNGDVGPTYYIETINTSIGIYNKATGALVTALTFNTFMSQGNFGNVCDTNNFGDPVVLYDSFEDRWIITDFAFTITAGNVNNPPGAFQCIAASKTGDPVTGGWNFYSINTTGGLGDYPKFGIWPDGLYMTVNMFGYPAGASFQSTRAYAFNKAQMYAGAPTAQSVSFDILGGDFTILPSNARLQTGKPPAGAPNYFLSTWLFLNALTVYKFHVDWDRISLSTFTGPDVPIAASSWPNAAVANAPSLGGNSLDVLQIRAMMQNQYSNIGGVESLWASHTVRRGNATGFAAPRFYQVDVTGGTVNAAIPQAATFDPDAANVMHRFMPSLAVDRAGNMALGYSTSSSTTKPAIKYAGRLSTDPINTFSQEEQLLIQGAGTQTGLCGGVTCTRWGDYSAMTLDPDGCTFWYTNMYYAVDGLNHKTRIGSFRFVPCTPVGAGGTVQGTVTETPGGAPINGATVALGARTTTTNGSGFYSFVGIPAGTYASETASHPGHNPSTTTNIVVTDGGITVKDFALTIAPASSCLTDTTQADFRLGVFTNVDVNTSPGDVTLVNLAIDQQNTAGTTTGTGFGTPSWTGQTFTPAVNGQLVKADVQVFCNGCGATPPNLTLSVRNTAAGLPTGADLASVTIPGSVFASGASVTFTASFGSPATLISGTQYALILRPVSVPAGSGYFWIRSSPSTYASGSRVLSADSGGTWSTDTTRDYNFKTYMQGPYSPTSGNVVSGTKDANPAPGQLAHWTSFSWNATVPANTSVQFQLAGSNSQYGPFNFVGPDGTAATFFTSSPVTNLNFLDGHRYVKYKAYLATTNSVVTPTVSDVTLCFSNLVAPQRTFVSAQTGNDANTVNNCSLLQPCRNFNAALGVVRDGGEVVAIDSGGYGPVTINKAVTLTAPAGVYAAITALTPGSSAITVNAAGGIGGDLVVLKGLTLTGLGGQNGINAIAVGNLNIERCVIGGFLGDGINVNLTADASRIVVKDSMLRENAGSGIRILTSTGLVRATIDNSRAEKNTINGFLASLNSRVTINRSVASGNGNVGFYAATTGAGVTGELECEQCVGSNNGYGFGVDALAAATAKIRVAHSTATNNIIYGFSQANSGLFESRGNNLVQGNVVGNTNGTITAITGQ